jgi:glutathione synthase/RimK-type ligase-like ATP-grasp enzyme
LAWTIKPDATARVLLVTGRDMPGPDLETPLLAEALRREGVAAEIAVWREPRDWGRASLVLLRTPWDYPSHLQEFLAWASQVAAVTRLCNGPDVVRWNLHKGYLLDLGARGVPIVPTRLVRRCEPVDAQRAIAEAARQFCARELVVKPAVGLNASGALRAEADSRHLANHLSSLLDLGDALIQPFAPSVLDAGELSLVFLGGEFSHAVRKTPRPGDYRVQNNHGGTAAPYPPATRELATARAALAIAPRKTTYARVDMVYLDDEPAVMELELIEPELFLRFWEPAAAAFARAVKAELET